MNLVEQYQPLVQNRARYFAQKYNMDRDDLEQVGYLVLLEMQDKEFGEDMTAISLYCNLRVTGAIRNYIAKNLGPVAVPSNAFWDHGERAYSDIVGDSTMADDPEKLYLEAEAECLFNEKVIAFISSLPPKERAVFYERVVAEEPMTTRELADWIGVKSPQTIVNIEKRVIEKAKEEFNEKVNECTTCICTNLNGKSCERSK